jgi:hypothetical protein
MQLVQLAPGFRPSAHDRRGALNDRSLVMRAINKGALTRLRGRTRCAQGAHGAGATHKIFVKVAASPSGGTCSQSWVFSSNASLPPFLGDPHLFMVAFRVPSKTGKAIMFA